MPNVLILGPYRFFFFYSEEGDEPAHIHVESGGNSAKFWLHNVELARSRGYKAHEISSIRKLVVLHRETFLEAWNVHLNRA